MYLRQQVDISHTFNRADRPIHFPLLHGSFSLGGVIIFIKFRIKGRLMRDFLVEVAGLNGARDERFNYFCFSF